MFARAAFAAACVTIFSGTPFRAGAGPLAPAKASDIVAAVVSPSSPPCPNGIANMFQVALRLDADGTRSELVIPPKSVLVVTRFSYSLSTLSPNQFRSAGLTVVEPVPAVEVPVASAADGTITDAFGVAAGSSEIPHGIVVKPPAVLCALLPNCVAESGAIIVNGFLAKSK